MASILILVSAVIVVLVHAAVRAVAERRALEREEAALEVLARVAQVKVDLGDDRLQHEHVRHDRSAHTDEGADFHVRVLGTRDRLDPAATPRPVPVSAVPPPTRRRPPPLRVVTEEPRRVTADGSSTDVAHIGWADQRGRGVLDERPVAEQRPLRFDSIEADDVGGSSPAPQPPALPPPFPPALDQPKRSVHRGVGPLPRWAPAVLAAAACLVVLAVAASTLGGGTDSPDRPESNAAATRTTEAAPTTTAVPPPPPAPVLVRGDDDGAEYRVGGGFGLAVRATDALYVRVNGADGTTLFEAILEPGQEQTFLSATPLRVRVGNASVAQIVVNGHGPILLPQTYSPYNLDLSTGDV